MEIRVVDFIPAHFECMVLRKEDAADLAGIDPELLYANWSESRTVFVNEEIAFFYGAEMRHGTGFLWAVTTAKTEEVPLLATRLGRNVIRALLRAGCHRVEANCHVENTRSLAWLTRGLGFSIEGIMRKCGPNKQDRYLLSIINQGD